MKRLLILSGGGAKGAFQAGVISCLVREGALKDNEILAVAGTSVGSINGVWCASRAALTPKGTDLMKQMWLSLSPKQVYKQQPEWFALLKALILKRNYLYDFSPLGKYLEKNVLPLLNFNKIYINCSVNLQNGKSTGIVVKDGNYLFEDQEIPEEQKEEILLKSILASCSIPLVFPPVKIGDNTYVDGGVREVIPLGFTIENLIKLKELKPGEEIQAIIISCTPLHTIKEERNYYTNLLALLTRAYDILWHEHLLNDVNQMALYNLLFPHNKMIKSHYVKINATLITPTRKLGDATDFTPSTLRKYFEMGESGNFIKYVSYR